MTVVHECLDNDSPWLICKHCGAVGRCELDAPAEQVRHSAQRALGAWDSTVLPKTNDGMMQERMEDLRASLAAGEGSHE